MTAENMMQKTCILTDGLKEISNSEKCRQKGGLLGCEKASQIKPEEVIEELKRSGLRGRGGAGFAQGWDYLRRKEQG